MLYLCIIFYGIILFGIMAREAYARHYSVKG